MTTKKFVQKLHKAYVVQLPVERKFNKFSFFFLLFQYDFSLS